MNKEAHHGVTQNHIEVLDGVSLLPEVHQELSTLKNLARDHGIEIVAISSYRSLERQSKIWNEKASGMRTLLDSQGVQLDFSSLSLEQIMHAILRWSAIPGYSRHHWGTDFDIVDQFALNENPDYSVELVPSEYQRGGIFEKLGSFLEGASLQEAGFFRPYRKDLGGVAEEPWHLSSMKYSLAQEQLLTLEQFNNWLSSKELSKLRLLNTLKENARDIFERYIINTHSNPMA